MATVMDGDVRAGHAPANAPVNTLYLVDASLYVFRAWHSMPDDFRDSDGWPTNAVHGFAHGHRLAQAIGDVPQVA